ncbi:MAG: DUF1998 domain-containing protein, partial [Methanophagales archaeon]|nr:DUF1998 domain-containing protein [Methanophagales archaeon]
MDLYLNFYNIGQQSALRVWSLKTDYRVFDKVTISEKIGVGQFSTTKTGQFWTTINTGGAGHVKRLMDEQNLHDVLKSALTRVKNCTCGLETSCYG